jgi:uncharacterized repeat protein (TIGR01451 family)
VPTPLPAHLAVSAAFSPQHPGKGQLAGVTIDVRNDGDGPAEGLVLTDVVSATTELRSASTPGGTCAISGRTLACELGRLGPADSTTVQVRVKVAREPATSTLSQHISLSSGEQADLAQQSVSALVDPGPPRGLALLDLPGPTVTIVALVTFVLAGRSTTTAAAARP